MTAELDPDIVLMDVRMPGDGRDRGDPPDRRRGPALARADPDDVRPRRVRLRGAPCGRERFSAEGRAAADLLSGIRAVASGDAVVSPSVTRRLLDSFAHRLPAPDDAAARADARLELAHRARARGARRDRARTARTPRSRPLVLSEATVKTHVGRILAKLELRDRVQAVVFAYDVGLAQPSPP